MPAALMLLTMLHATTASPDTTIRLTRGTAIEINTYNAAVNLSVGSDDLLRIRGGSVDVDGRSADVEGDDPSRPSAGTLEVTVPAWAKVEIDTYNGAITLTGSPARLDATTVNGRIMVKGGSGALALESVGGDMTVSNFHGERLSVDAVSGTVTITGSSGAFEIESVNGSIRMRDMQASSVKASAVNEMVEYSGTIDPKGRYELESHNGGVVLAVPADVSARLKVSTFNGSFTTEIPATTNGDQNQSRGGKRSEEREFTVVYGRGAADISVDTFNGSVQVLRYRGRSN